MAAPIPDCRQILRRQTARHHGVDDAIADHGRLATRTGQAKAGQFSEQGSAHEIL